MGMGEGEEKVWEGVRGLGRVWDRGLDERDIRIELKGGDRWGHLC